MDAVGHALVEVDRPHDSLYAPTPHLLAYFVAYAGEGEGDSLALQFSDEIQQRVAGAGVDSVHRFRVQKHVFYWRVARRHCSFQLIVQTTDAGKEQVSARSPNHQSREGECLGVEPDVAIGLFARQLTQYRALWVAGAVDQQQQRQHHTKGDTLQDTQRQLAGDDDRADLKLPTTAGE